MRSITNVGLVLLILLVDGPGTVAEMLARLNLRTGGLLTLRSSALRGALAYHHSRGNVVGVYVPERGTRVYDLTETGRASALDARQGLAALVDITWRAP